MARKQKEETSKMKKVKRIRKSRKPVNKAPILKGAELDSFITDAVKDLLGESK